MPTFKLSVSRSRRKAEKNIYCKKCGGLIDNKSRRCDGCGKQYFKLPKVTLAKIALLLLFCGLVGLNVYQYATHQSTELALNSEIQSSEKSLASYKESYIAVSSLNEEMRTELYFWSNSAVICTTTGAKYHHYGCEHLKDVKSIYIYNVENAKAQGYTPCLDCCGG